MKRMLSRNSFRMFCLALLATVAFAGCGKGCGKKEVSKEEAEAFQLIPLESNIVVGMNWKKIFESPLGEKMNESVPPEIAPFLKEIDGVTLGFSVKGVGQEPENFVAIISGKLDSVALLAKLAEQAKKEGKEVTNEEYEGIKIYNAPKDPSIGIAFVGDKGVVGKVDGVKKVIDLSKKKGESIEKNKNLMGMINDVDTNKMLWAVGVVPEGAIPAGGAPGGPGNPLGALSGVKALDLSIDFYKDLTLDLGIVAGAEEEAQQMMTMANSYKTLFGTSLAQKDPIVGKVLNGLNIGVKGNRVTLSLKLDQATVEALSEKAKNKKAQETAADSEGP